MGALELLENNIIKWNENNAIKATDLHKWLGVKTRFNMWINRMLSRDFEKGFDYVEQIETTGGRPITNYILTLDTAKEISMMTRSETGRQVRKYFIEIEKKYTKMYEELLTKNVQKLTLCQKQLVELGLEMNTSALTYKGKLYTVTEIAKEYGVLILCIVTSWSILYSIIWKTQILVQDYHHV